MNQPYSAPGNYFLAINDTADGPHSAAHIMSLWRAGTIDGNTMICPEGGDAWVSLHEMAAVLEPPVASGARVAPGAAPRRVQQVVIRKSDRMKGFRMGSLIAALICFFLPWVELQCSGQRLVYQSGVQTVIRQGSADSKMKELAQASGKGGSSEFKMEELDEKIERSYLAGGALLALMIALGVGAAKSGRVLSSVFALVAAGCLGVQAIIGFPLQASFEKEVMGDMRKAMNSGAAEASARDLVPGLKPGAGTPGAGDPDLAVRQAMGEKMMAEMFGVRLAPWFYVELGLLVLAAALGFFGVSTTREIRQPV